MTESNPNTDNIIIPDTYDAANALSDHPTSMTQSYPNPVDTFIPDTYDGVNDFSNHPTSLQIRSEWPKLQRQLTSEQQDRCKTIVREFMMLWSKPGADDVRRLQNAQDKAKQKILEVFPLPDSDDVQVKESLRELLKGVVVNDLPTVCDLMDVDIATLAQAPPGNFNVPEYLKPTPAGREAAWKMATESKDSSKILQDVIGKSSHSGGDGEKIARQLQGRAVDAIEDKFANFVLQKIIQELYEEEADGGEIVRLIAQEIVKAKAKGGAIGIACTQHGCRIVREILKVCKEGDLVDEVLGLEGAYRLMTHELHFGHHALDVFEDPEETQRDLGRDVSKEHLRVVKSVSRHMEECMKSKDGRYYVMKQLKKCSENKLNAQYIDANPDDYASVLTNALLRLNLATYAEMAQHKDGFDILHSVTKDAALKSKLSPILHQLEGKDDPIRTKFEASEFGRKILDDFGLS